MKIVTGAHAKTRNLSSNLTKRKRTPLITKKEAIIRTTKEERAAAKTKAPKNNPDLSKTSKKTTSANKC